MDLMDFNDRKRTLMSTGRGKTTPKKRPGMEINLDVMPIYRADDVGRTFMGAGAACPGCSCCR